MEDHYELLCKNKRCPHGEEIKGVFQPWWNHVSLSELADDVEHHLNVCAGPLSVIRVPALTRKKD
jgi:hypothetical protein